MESVQFLFNYYLCILVVKLNIKYQIALLVIKTNIDIIDKIASLATLYYIKNFKP